MRVWSVSVALDPWTWRRSRSTAIKRRAIFERDDVCRWTTAMKRLCGEFCAYRVDYAVWYERRFGNSLKTSEGGLCWSRWFPIVPLAQILFPSCSSVYMRLNFKFQKATLSLRLSKPCSIHNTSLSDTLSPVLVLMWAETQKVVVMKIIMAPVDYSSFTTATEPFADLSFSNSLSHLKSLQWGKNLCDNGNLHKLSSDFDTSLI